MQLSTPDPATMLARSPPVRVSESRRPKLNMEHRARNNLPDVAGSRRPLPSVLSHTAWVGRTHDALRLVQLPQIIRRPHHAPLGVRVGPRDDALSLRVRDFGMRAEL